MRYFLITFLFLLCGVGIVSGQVSQKGNPIKVPLLKSREIPVKVMPPLNIKELQQQFEEEKQKDNRLKKFQFAEGFEVHISPEVDGLWTKNISGMDVWQIKIHSAGAYSLNLIFENFHLPYGASLFLFNEEAGHYLGAFTSLNNRPSEIFAVSPVKGDIVTVQYEIPAGYDGKNDFVITTVNHDFAGILKFDDRRPTGVDAGLCNIDINCADGTEWANQIDAVCRIITTKNIGTKIISEICTGTLVNNTAKNQKPYILTAAHCIEKAEFAETSIFTFNYESPYCAPLDGDPGHSISGSRLLAISDSLDFALVEMSTIPPPEYRPFFAGWDRRHIIPGATVSIHHPQGGVKKLSIDNDPPEYSDFDSEYTPLGFFRIKEWDAGVTERGSSGGPLFGPDHSLIGTLTGGLATCQVPVDDYFSRFELAWTYRADSTKQLKYWLDPINSNALVLPGNRFYENENYSVAYTNLEDFDTHQNVILYNNNAFAGYWGGTNNAGITGFAERFTISGDEYLSGVSMGIGMIKLSPQGFNSEITVNVFNGGELPETLIYSQKVQIKNLDVDAMNFIGFSELVEPSDTFYVGFELSNLQPLDTFVVYQSLRQPEKINNFCFKQNNLWYDFKDSNIENYSMTNVFELVIFNAVELVPDTPLVDNPAEALIYPNPTVSTFILETDQVINPENIRIFNLIGQEVNAKFFSQNDNKIQIDLSGNRPGVYFVRFKTPAKMITEKVTYIPW